MTITKSALSSNWMVYQFGNIVYRGAYEECQDYAERSVIETGNKVSALMLIE